MAYRQHNANYELRLSDGTPSGMFYGYAKSLLSLKKKYRGYKFIVAWDNKAQWKYDIYPEYKSNRVSLPSTVFSQIPSIKEFLKYVGIDQYDKSGEEADDVIASLVESLKNKEDTGTIVIYSNDKDLLQLVKTGKIVVYKPKVGVIPEKFYDEEAVKSQFGVYPNKLVNFRIFDGDGSDTIVGIPRVPRKIISDLVNSNDTIDDIYKSLSSIKLTKFRKEAFEGFRSQLEVNSKIMLLNKNLMDLNKIEGVVSKEGIADMLKKYEIVSIDSESYAELFMSSLTIKYSDARPAYRLESYSLFD